MPLIQFYSFGGSSRQFIFNLQSSNKLRFRRPLVDLNIDNIAATSYTSGNWLSACVTTNASSWAVYQNGLALESGTYSSTPAPLQGSFVIGKHVRNEVDGKYNTFIFYTNNLLL